LSRSGERSPERLLFSQLFPVRAENGVKPPHRFWCSRARFENAAAFKTKHFYLERTAFMLRR
jgi:hypothetical protein